MHCLKNICACRPHGVLQSDGGTANVEEPVSIIFPLRANHVVTTRWCCAGAAPCEGAYYGGGAGVGVAVRGRQEEGVRLMAGHTQGIHP